MTNSLKILLVSVVLQFKYIIAYYCFYSAIVYTFCMNFIEDPDFPQWVANNQRLVVVLIAIISARLTSDKISGYKKDVVEKSIKIRKPGEQINN